MTTLIEDDTQFAEAFFAPDDGNGRAVGSVNPALQALANRTKFLRAALMPMIALNFTAPIPTTTTMQRGCYAGKSFPVWIMVNPGLTNDVKITTPGGSAADSLSPSAGPPLDVATDGADPYNLVIPTRIGGGVAAFSATTGAWTNTALESGFQFDNACVSYDATSGLWCVVYRRTSGTLVKAWTSPDRVTWTQRTLPVAFTGALPSAVPLSAAGGGTTIIANVAASGTVDVAYSTDGGITWGSGNFATFAGATIVRPAYGNGIFMILAYDAATYRTQVWTSATGAAWTKVQEYPTRVRMTALANVGKLWVSAGLIAFGAVVMPSRQVLYSIDNGATWRPGGFGGIIQNVIGGPGAVMLLDGANARPSILLGPAPALAVV